MHKVDENFLKQVGLLVKRARSENLSQEELATRLGISRKTVSSIERGIGVNSNALVNVMAFLNLLPALSEVVEQQLDKLDDAPKRKLRKPKPELPNDF